MNRLFLILGFVILSPLSFSQETDLTAFSYKTKELGKWSSTDMCNHTVHFGDDDTNNEMIIDGKTTYTMINISKSESKNQFGKVFSYAAYNQELTNCVITIQCYDVLKIFDITIEYSDFSICYTCK